MVGTLGPDGMTLYVDGVKVATDPTTTSAQSYSGYWRIGGDNLDGWTNQPTSRNFNGTIDEVVDLPAGADRRSRSASSSRRPASCPNIAPTAAFTSTSTVPRGDFRRPHVHRFRRQHRVLRVELR